jgi:hypothetical protein
VVSDGNILYSLSSILKSHKKPRHEEYAILVGRAAFEALLLFDKGGSKQTSAAECTFPNASKHHEKGKQDSGNDLPKASKGIGS